MKHSILPSSSLLGSGRLLCRVSRQQNPPELATFIWRSLIERTRCSNLFLSLEEGGLGLVKVVLKLHVQLFLLFRDTRNAIFLSALHYLGYPYLATWMVSTTGRITRGANLRFYTGIASSIEFSLDLFSWEYLLTISGKKM